MNKEQNKRRNLKSIVSTAMLAAVAGVLMSVEFSVPFMPPFYKIDFSDVPTIIGLFAFGPASAFAIEVIKIMIKLITVGTNSAYVGELANLIGIFIFILPIWFTFKAMKQTKKAAKISLIVSVPVRVAFSCFVNACITLPLYAAAMGMSLEQVVQAVAYVNPAITNLTTFLVLATIPFNLVKGILNASIGYVMYERLAKANVFEQKFAAPQKAGE